MEQSYLYLLKEEVWLILTLDLTDSTTTRRLPGNIWERNHVIQGGMPQFSSSHVPCHSFPRDGTVGGFLSHGVAQ